MLVETVAFTDELLERKEEIFALAGIDVNTYRDEEHIMDIHYN